MIPFKETHMLYRNNCLLPFYLKWRCQWNYKFDHGISCIRTSIYCGYKLAHYSAVWSITWVGWWQMSLFWYRTEQMFLYNIFRATFTLLWAGQVKRKLDLGEVSQDERSVEALTTSTTEMPCCGWDDVSAGGEPKDSLSAVPWLAQRQSLWEFTFLWHQAHHGFWQHRNCLADGGKSKETAGLANIPVDRVIPSSSVPSAMSYC